LRKENKMGMLYKKKKRKSDGTVGEPPNWHLKYYREDNPKKKRG